MNKQSMTRISKFIAFLIVAVIVISVVILTASGENADNITPNFDKIDSTNNSTLNDTADKTDKEDGKNDSTTGNEIENSPSDTESSDKPIFYNKITGQECSEEEYNTTAFGVVIDPALHSYGLSYSDISIEFPTESGATRMLFFSSSADTIWKIGGLAPSRQFISAMSSYLGGIIIGNGYDDKISYNMSGIGNFIDISKHTDCIYQENSAYYTNENLINIALNRTQLSTSTYQYNSAPYIFSEEATTYGIPGANNIIIPYSPSSATSLVYDKSVMKYVYCKNGETKIDMLTGKDIGYKNVFILFANSTTYENANASELVIDTESGGRGYYFTDGCKTEFTWQKNASGELIFYNIKGEILSVNTGNAYIAFCKATESNNVQIY